MLYFEKETRNRGSEVHIAVLYCLTTWQLCTCSWVLRLWSYKKIPQ